jgi:hypothetical protein
LKGSFELDVIVDKNWECASNGKIISETLIGDLKKV